MLRRKVWNGKVDSKGPNPRLHPQERGEMPLHLQDLIWASPGYKRTQAFQDMIFRLTFNNKFKRFQEEVCEENFEKSCQLTFKQQAQNETVRKCYRPLIKVCDGQGPEECRTLYESACTTKVAEIQDQGNFLIALFYVFYLVFECSTSRSSPASSWVTPSARSFRSRSAALAVWPRRAPRSATTRWSPRSWMCRRRPVT